MRWPILACLFFAAAAAAAEPDWSLLHDGSPLFPGEPFQVQLLATNGRPETVSASLPATLSARLRGSGYSGEVVLRADKAAQATVELAPGGFLRRFYTGVMPVDTPGVVQLELSDRKSNRLTLASEAPRLAQAAPSAPAVAPAAAPATVPRAQLRRDPEPALSAFEPMYFILGSRGDTSAKFQLSFKYQLFDVRGFVADFLPEVSNLYFGYTQTSIWDLSSHSKPFRDTSYHPSLFYLWRDSWRREDNTAALDWRLGLEHESNGRDQETSRSVNLAYVRPELRMVLAGSRYFAVAPRLWAYLDREDNPGIARYRGYGDLALRYGHIDGWQWAVNLRRGSAGHGAVQFDASYPLKRPLFANVGGYLHLQYFNGYGESLLDYNLRRRSQFRIGFSVVR